MDPSNQELAGWGEEAGVAERVHTLNSSGESFPNVVCTTMACGTPLLVTDVVYAAAIVAWLGARSLDPGVWERRRVQTRSRIETDFGLARMVEEYRRVGSTAGSGWAEAAVRRGASWRCRRPRVRTRRDGTFARRGGDRPEHRRAGHP